MIRDAAVDILMGRLGRKDHTGLRQEIIDEMVQVQENILEGYPELPWFLVSESSTIDTVPTEYRIPLPEDFLQEWADGGVFKIEDDGTETMLRREDWDLILQRFNEGYISGDDPEYYDIAGDYILTRPIPTRVQVIRMRYYARDAALAGTYGGAGNVENNWLKWASDLLISETGIVVAQGRSYGPDKVKMFAAQASAARARLDAKTTAMEESNKERFMEG